MHVQANVNQFVCGAEHKEDRLCVVERDDRILAWINQLVMRSSQGLCLHPRPMGLGVGRGRGRNRVETQAVAAGCVVG